MKQNTQGLSIAIPFLKKTSSLLCDTLQMCSKNLCVCTQATFCELYLICYETEKFSFYKNPAAALLEMGVGWP